MLEFKQHRLAAPHVSAAFKHGACTPACLRATAAPTPSPSTGHLLSASRASRTYSSGNMKLLRRQQQHLAAAAAAPAAAGPAELCCQPAKHVTLAEPQRPVHPQQYCAVPAVAVVSAAAAAASHPFRRSHVWNSSCQAACACRQHPARTAAVSAAGFCSCWRSTKKQDDAAADPHACLRHSGVLPQCQQPSAAHRRLASCCSCPLWKWQRCSVTSSWGSCRKQSQSKPATRYQPSS